MSTGAAVREKAEWHFWLRWVSANVAACGILTCVAGPILLSGFPIALLLGALAGALIGAILIGVAGFIAGAIVGHFQQRILRRHVARSGQWATATSISCALIFAIVGGLLAMANGPVFIFAIDPCVGCSPHPGFDQKQQAGALLSLLAGPLGIIASGLLIGLLQCTIVERSWRWAVTWSLANVAGLALAVLAEWLLFTTASFAQTANLPGPETGLATFAISVLPIASFAIAFGLAYSAITGAVLAWRLGPALAQDALSPQDSQPLIA